MAGTRVRPPAGPSVNLVPAIHVFPATETGVDARDKPGHDDRRLGAAALMS